MRETSRKNSARPTKKRRPKNRANPASQFLALRISRMKTRTILETTMRMTMKRKWKKSYVPWFSFLHSDYMIHRKWTRVTFAH